MADQRQLEHYHDPMQRQALQPSPDLKQKRARNNPRNEPTGPFTGRCGNCGSKNLWDDNLAYGCNDCGAVNA